MRVHGAFPRSCAGPAKSRLARCSTASCATRTCCRLCWLSRAIRTSARSCSNGYTVGDKTFKVHIDGLNQLDYITGEAKESPRDYFFYVSDDGGVMAIRVGDYKMTFEQQRATTMRAWAEPFVKLRLPYICNLRRDPFERAEFNSNTYLDWMVDHVPQLYLAQAVTAGQIQNYIKYPPRQKAASFNLDSVMASLGPAQAAYKAQEAAAEKAAAAKKPVPVGAK